uniref:Cytochrome c oxidase subunit 1 n=1 Tax=Pyropia kanakaensis TaxID=139729 RepID=A0A060D781_9RHOD|nr:cytochrome c oxidase subunit 1 [Pyropia kanakaensis]
MSRPELASIMPVRPPIVNKNMKPIANSIGVFKKIDPSHIVATQLWTRTYTPRSSTNPFPKPYVIVSHHTALH